MNYEQRQQVLEQLPQGAKITKVYTAFENGETRVIVKLPNCDFETRYVLAEDKKTGTVALIEKP